MIITLSIYKRNAGGRFENIAFIDNIDYCNDSNLSYILYEGQLYESDSNRPPYHILDLANNRTHIIFFADKVKDISVSIHGEILYKKTKGLKDHKICVKKDNTTKHYKRGDVGYKQAIKSLHKNFLDKLDI